MVKEKITMESTLQLTNGNTSNGAYLGDVKGSSAESSDLTPSDASMTSLKSSDGYLPTNDPTSSSESDLLFSSDEDASSEDVEETIDFIRQKQGILKRAASVLFDQEETYDAATARATSRITEPVNCPGSVWAQAERIVPQKRTPMRRINMRRNTSGPNRGAKKTIQPNPRDRSINLDEVRQMGSEQFDNVVPDESSTEETNDGLPEVAFPQGQWMAQALIRGSSASPVHSPSNPDDCLWKVISDPITCSLGLVPPSTISMEHGISIEEALSFSEEGRLLTQATPQFCVVYVNKAFMILGDLASKAALIGRPVESFLQVTQDIMNSPKSKYDEDFMRARLMRNEVALQAPEDDSDEDDSVPCRVMIVPVMDRTRRRRLTPRSHHSTMYSCMSHVLIRVHKSDEAVSPSSSSQNLRLSDLFAVSESDSKKEEESSYSSNSVNSIRSNMVETVG